MNAVHLNHSVACTLYLQYLTQWKELNQVKNKTKYIFHIHIHMHLDKSGLDLLCCCVWVWILLNVVLIYASNISVSLSLTFCFYLFVTLVGNFELYTDVTANRLFINCATTTVDMQHRNVNVLNHTRKNGHSQRHTEKKNLQLMRERERKGRKRDQRHSSYVCSYTNVFSFFRFLLLF